MSQRDEKDLFQNEKTGQGRTALREGRVIRREGRVRGGRMMCTAQKQTKQNQEPQGAECLSASKLFTHSFTGLSPW